MMSESIDYKEIQKFTANVSESPVEKLIEEEHGQKSINKIQHYLFSSVFALTAFAGLAGCRPPEVKTPPEPISTMIPSSPSTEEVEVGITLPTPSYTPNPTKTHTPTPTISSPTATNTSTFTPTITATPERTAEPFFIPPGELGYNYFYFPESPFWEDKGFQVISFIAADLEEISVDGEYLIVKMRTVVRNQEIVLQSRIKGFNFGDNGFHYITPENINDFRDKLAGKRIRPSFLYSQRKRTAQEKEIIFNTCNYTGDSEGGVDAKETYMPLCANWDMYQSLDTKGVLTKDMYAEFLLGQPDLNNIDVNLISPLDYLGATNN